MTGTAPKPTISVVMGVYNGALYLDEAVRSILRQTFDDFEFIIIDDGSEDDTAEMLEVWAGLDSRVVILTNPVNRGLTRSLNRGIRHARGAWIARQDADDRSLPERFARQMAFLADHPDVGIVGTGRWLVDREGNRFSEPQPKPLRHSEILWDLQLENPFLHTSVVVRKALMIRHPYDESLPFGQDFELWGRILAETRGANLPEPLVESRLHCDRISVTHNERQQQIGRDIVTQRLETLLPEVAWTEERLGAIRNLVNTTYPVQGETAADWLLLLRLFQRFEAGRGLETRSLRHLKRILLERLARSLLSPIGITPNREILGAVWRYDAWNLSRSLLKILCGRMIRRLSDRFPSSQ